LQQFYQFGLRPLLFNLLKADAETVHRQTIDTLAWLATNPNAGPLFISRLASLLKPRWQGFAKCDRLVSISLFGTARLITHWA